MGAHAITHAQAYAWYAQIFHFFYTDTGQAWLYHEQYCPSPHNLYVWKFLIFGDPLRNSSNQHGPLSECLDVIMPGAASQLLYAWQSKLSRTRSFNRGGSRYVYQTMSGKWHYHVHPAAHDNKSRWWCEVQYMEEMGNLRKNCSVWEYIQPERIPTAALLDILVGVWSSPEFPEHTRADARELLCNLAETMIQLLADWIPKPQTV